MTETATEKPTADSPLLAGRESALMTLLRSDDPWETKRDALAAFAFQPTATSEGPNDDTPPPAAEDSFDEVYLAEAAGVLTAEQVDELTRLLEAKAGASAEPVEPVKTNLADRDAD
jgi:hypothetical protein